MVRTVDHESRRKAILAAAINRYIDKGIPVASEDIAEEFNLSSATVRNIFADLEQGGYLTHPYTSGGRIPTTKGYRYYVDFLISEMELLESEKVSITSAYKKELKRVEDVLERTSELISGVTHYAGIAALPEKQEKVYYKGLSRVLSHQEFRNYDNIRLLINLIEDSERLSELMNRDFEGNVKVYIGEELHCPEIQSCSLIVSSYKMKNKPKGKVAVLGPTRMEYKHSISAVEYIANMLTEVLQEI